MQADGDNLARNVAGSLTFHCMACVALYAIAMSLLLTGARDRSQLILSRAYTSLDVLVEQDNVLDHDRFDLLASRLPEGSEAIVFDAEGVPLYATSTDIASQITFSDLSIVSAANGSETYYEVIDRPTGPQPEGGLEILLCQTDEDLGTEHVLGSCVCDRDLNILHGDLFAPLTSLSPREFALITGNYRKNSTIEKCEYVTVDGDDRVIVLVTPKVDSSMLERLINESQNVWLPVIPIALLLTAASIAGIYLTIKRSMEPLDQAILAKNSGVDDASVASRLPIELRGTYLLYAELMDGLKQAREENQTLIADISHDLKTPLAVIGGYARALEDDKVPPERQRDCVHAILLKSNEANTLLDTLFSLARLNHPAFRPNLETVDLMEEVRLAAIAGSAQVEEAGDHLVVDMADGVLVGHADRQLLGRVLANLISNACKHNPPGTTIMVACVEQSGHARISVADTGVGFPRELRDTAFEPFVTQNVARESEGGTGLGLAIARRGIEVQGGSIRLSQTAPHPYVTEVVIELPLQACENASPEASGDQPSPAVRR